MKQSATRLDLVLLSAIVGLLGGLLGALIVVLVFLPSRSAETPLESARSREREIKIDEIAVLTARTIVEWYPARVVDAKKGTLSSEDAVAFGAVATSDGWLIGPPLLAHGGLVPVVDRVRLVVEKTIQDPWTGLVFIKTKESNLNVVSFREATPRMGETVMTPLRGRGFVTTSIAAVRAPSLRAKGMFTSDLALAEERDDGAPVFDQNGKVVGLVSVADGPRRVIPVTHFAGVLRSVLRAGKAVRPVLGVQVIDASSVAVSGDLLRGALVVAVHEKSPAARAHIVPKDTIMAVDDKSVDASHDLYELLMAYDPGAEVRLLIFRNGATKIIPVTLTGS